MAPRDIYSRRNLSKICLFETFSVRMFGLRTLLSFRSFSIYVQMCVLLSIVLEIEFKRSVNNLGTNRNASPQYIGNEQ